jgi:hypothetical protein
MKFAKFYKIRKLLQIFANFANLRICKKFTNLWILNAQIMLDYDERYHNQTCKKSRFAKIYKIVEIREFLQNPQTFTKPRSTHEI